MKKMIRKISVRVFCIAVDIGTIAERCWDEIKKFLWWLVAPNAYADLHHAYTALQIGYNETYRTWQIDGEYDAERIRELTEERDRLKEENAVLKARLREKGEVA